MIHVHKNWYIDADRYCYCLFKQEEVEDKKTGELKLIQKHKSYHSTVSSCLQAFVRLQHRNYISSHDVEFNDAITKFEKLENFILTTVKGTVI